MRSRITAIGASLVLCLLVASPASAAAFDEQFKSEIEEFLNKLTLTTQGLVSWEGSDALDFRHEGEAAVAIIGNARLAIHEAQTSQIVFDHIEIRRAPVAGSPNAAKLDIVFPTQSTLTLADGTKTGLSLKDATASLVVEEASNRFRETVLSFAGARLEHPTTGDWMNFGPMSFASKLVGAADGGWSTPIDFELKQVEFFLTEVPIGGAIDRIAYDASSSGPDVAALNRLRDRIDELRQQGERPPAARLDALLELLPTVPTLFSLVKGEATVEGVAVRAATGEPLVGLAKTSIGGALTGLSGDTAAWRITLRQNGLTLANAILGPSKVPQDVVIDFGLEDVATGPLRTLLEAIGKARNGTNDADSQQATGRMLGAAAMLNPVFRIHEVALQTKDVGISATGKTTGSPLAPKGYTAEADVVVRGFDALPALVADLPGSEYLPLLKVIGTAAAGSDTKFHLASTPQKWITINGNDVTGWFADDKPAPGQPRQLRPAQPAQQGDDVRAVQRALASAKITAPQTGIYDGATAAAVAQFQKQNGLNVDGVVSAATRDKLGLKPAPPSGGAAKPPSRPN
jgi:Putative peptidoglycan binding domain